jgi:hydroxyacylglutathione hydrolase
MKFKQLTPHVWGGYIKIPLPVMLWIIDGAEGLTIVDGGMPLMERPLVAFLQRQFPGKQVVRLLLTHGHVDHIGATYGLQAQTGLKVMLHEREIPFLTGQRTYNSLRGKNKPDGIKPFAPDVLEALDPHNLYDGLQPYETPGHSPGHVAYYHCEDDILLAGDMFTSFFGKLRRPIPIFTADMEQALDSTQLLEELKPRLLSCSHGPVLENVYEEYPNFIRKHRKNRLHS